MRYQFEFTPTALHRLKKLSQHSPRLVEIIMRKIIWLAEHAEEIAHRPIRGSPFYSLHSGPYRIPYLLDKSRQRIIIDDIAQHDPAYDRIRRM